MSLEVSPGAVPHPTEPVDRSRVTVVLPTYNRKESLKRCLAALLLCDPGGSRVDVLVVDDGSGDGTAEMVRALNAGNSGPFTFRCLSQPNQGQAVARNTGLAAANTDLVLFIDDDCVPDPAWLRSLVETDWESGIGGAGGKIVAAERDNWVSRYCRYIRFNDFPSHQWKQLKFINTANCAYRRSALLAVRGMERHLSGGGEDLDLSWRVMLLGYRLEYRPEAVVHHFHRENLRVLFRTFWTRGYRSTLRRILWEFHPRPDQKRIGRERRALLRLLPRGLLLARDARNLAAQGIPREDALRFACLDWLQQIIWTSGKIRMMSDIVKGRQPLERTCVVPPGKLDPAIIGQP